MLVRRNLKQRNRFYLTLMSFRGHFQLFYTQKTKIFCHVISNHSSCRFRYYGTPDSESESSVLDLDYSEVNPDFKVIYSVH